MIPKITNVVDVACCIDSRRHGEGTTKSLPHRHLYRTSRSPERVATGFLSVRVTWHLRRAEWSHEVSLKRSRWADICRLASHVVDKSECVAKERHMALTHVARQPIFDRSLCDRGP